MAEKQFAVKKTNLYEQIADNLEHEIIYSKNEIVKLPSEKDLSIQYNVSKTAIREALKVLKERGLITSKNGEGSFVTKPDMSSISNSLNRFILLEKINNQELLELRMVLENASARKAAKSANEADIKKLEMIIEKIASDTIPPEERYELDALFHKSIAIIGKNPLIKLFVEIFNQQIRNLSVKGDHHQSIKKTYTEHKKIIDAIKARDPEKAEQAMQNHLDVVRKNIKKIS